MPPRRQFLNDPGTIVAQALDGLERANPGIVRWNRDPSFVIRADDDRPDRVAVISGGGSGHEPLHTGFVGRGHARRRRARRDLREPVDAPDRGRDRRRSSRGRGVVHVVKNYTGDIINFGLARDDAVDEGIAVETVVVADDLATDADDRRARPPRHGRGDRRREDLRRRRRARREPRAGRRARARGRRGLALARGRARGAARIPGADGPSFELAAGEIEFGVGIHGERGIERRPYATARRARQGAGRADRAARSSSAAATA